MCEIVTQLVVNSPLGLCSCIYFGWSSVISYMGIEQCFFFYVKIGQPSVKMFAVTLREKAKSA